MLCPAPTTHQTWPDIREEVLQGTGRASLIPHWRDMLLALCLLCLNLWHAHSTHTALFKWTQTGATNGKVKDHWTTSSISRGLIEFLKPTSTSSYVATSVTGKVLLQTESISLTTNMVKSISLVLPRRAVCTQECCYGFSELRIFCWQRLTISSVNSKVCSQSRGRAGRGLLSPQWTQRELLCDVWSTMLSAHCLRTKEQPSLSQYNQKPILILCCGMKDREQRSCTCFSGELQEGRQCKQQLCILLCRSVSF